MVRQIRGRNPTSTGMIAAAVRSVQIGTSAQTMVNSVDIWNAVPMSDLRIGIGGTRFGPEASIGNCFCGPPMRRSNCARTSSASSRGR